jgi:hypothetical protein
MEHWIWKQKVLKNCWYFPTKLQSYSRRLWQYHSAPWEPIILKEATRSFEMSVHFYQNTWRLISSDSDQEFWQPWEPQRLKKEAARCSETLVSLYKIKWRRFPENSHLLPSHDPKILKVEPLCTSESLVYFYQTILRHNPSDSNSKWR